MIRVLEVLATLRRAGAERVAVELACGLDRGRFEPAVVSLYDAYEGGFEAELAAHEVPVWHLGKRRGMDPRIWGRLAGVIRRFRPLIIHTHSYVLRYALPARWLAWRGRLVHTVHNLAMREVDLPGRLIHRAAYGLGVASVAISAEVACSFRRAYGREPDAIIYNGADVRQGFRQDARERWRRAHGLKSTDLLIVSLARFEPQKNPLGLLEAFAAALAQLPDAYLVMAGEGSLLGECQRRAGQYGIAGRAVFLGLCRDTTELLSACDIFALASHWEGMPVAVIEAMAARLPAVVTSAGGLPEMVEDGVSGVLVPPGDIRALSRALVELGRNPARRRQMGEQARRRAMQFDVRKMVESYAGLFERLCGGTQ